MLLGLWPAGVASKVHDRHWEEHDFSKSAALCGFNPCFHSLRFYACSRQWKLIFFIPHEPYTTMKYPVLALLVVGLIAQSAYAVDGYKDFKFGMSVPDVKKAAKISLTRVEQGDGVTLLQGRNFPFGGQNVEIGFFFIGSKLLRVAFEIPHDAGIVILDALKEKYGEPSSLSDEKTFKAVDTTPNTQAFIAFDDDTVVWKVVSDESSKQTALVIYTSPDYDKLLGQAQKKGVKDDL